MPLLQTTYKILSNSFLSSLTPYVEEEFRIMCVDSDVIDKLLIRYSAFVKHWRKMRL